MKNVDHISTGMLELDTVLDGLRIGDNVVFKVEGLEDYRYFVEAFARQSAADGCRLHYLRFGGHAPLLESDPQIQVHHLDAQRGFEHFTGAIHHIVTQQGPGAFYVFDCLSELLTAWATDAMIGDFFRVTCPYLYELETVAYFALIRDRHSLKTIERIRGTTQVLIDVFTHEGEFYIHPLKVWQRRSPTMFLPHRRVGAQLEPLISSFESTHLYTALAERTRDSFRRHIDHWHHLFIEAEKLSAAQTDPQSREAMVRHLCRHMMARDERMLNLARRFFTLRDLLDIQNRLIGTGFIGGKAVGMLLAHNILRCDQSFPWERHLEVHDSHYVGSNVYYGYLVHNGLWRLFMRQKNAALGDGPAADLREALLDGVFPEEIRERFRQMLEYYGQYPIIIRSSSLLEDSFGNAFAGKYDSYFQVNQGSPDERLEQLEAAIRKIYASTMSDDALVYRRQRGLAERDEQMALLIQRVSGAYRGHYYFPELSGVGVSYNTFVWDSRMDPRAGMMRLVVGLGTRAVDRADSDYPRVVALDAPDMRQHKGFADLRKFSQRDIDLLNLDSNSVETVSLLQLTRDDTGIPWQLYAVQDYETAGLLEQRGRSGEKVWLLVFDDFLAKTDFAELIKRLLKTVEAAYQYPVDIEFTANFTPDRTVKIDVVQCRPLQTRGSGQHPEIPGEIPETDLFFRSSGHFMGGNSDLLIDWVVWVEPAAYLELGVPEKYQVARLVGELNRVLHDQASTRVMLIGPGRWGTSTPSLGVPVTFAQISELTALVEVAFPSGGLMPELSFGSHFFQDLVEADIFYLALFPENQGCVLNRAWFEGRTNLFSTLLPEEAEAFSGVLHVYRTTDRPVRLMADIVSQELVCFSTQPDH